MKSKLAVVFDLDKTIGYFTQIAVVMDAIEEVLGRELTLKEFFSFLDLYKYTFRNEIFKVFKYLKNKKKANQNLKVLIYTNNMGPKSWVYKIKKYIEHELKYKLFDRVIAAWKVGQEIYEPKRTTHNKTYNDLLRCSRLGKNYKILFLDDMDHKDLRLSKQVTYLKVDEYTIKKRFCDLIDMFMKSSMRTIFSNKLNRLNIRIRLEKSVNNSWYPKVNLHKNCFYRGKLYYNNIKDFVDSKSNKNTKRKKNSRNKTKKKRRY
tara:strand:+ start:176 stop:961 length:786 start_codon:yes stop_codon:yes gene_type:complete